MDKLGVGGAFQKVDRTWAYLERHDSFEMEPT